MQRLLRQRQSANPPSSATGAARPTCGGATASCSAGTARRSWRAARTC